MRFDHVALLVRDLDSAVQDYVEILSVLDPEQVHEIVWNDGVVDGFNVRWATFVKHDGGVVIQLLESQVPNDQKLLEKRGECVHHLAFCSTDVEETVKQLADSKIPLTSQRLSGSPDKPWLKWTFVHPRKAHGVLVEVSQQYKVENGDWVKEDIESEVSAVTKRS